MIAPQKKSRTTTKTASKASVVRLRAIAWIGLGLLAAGVAVALLYALRDGRERLDATKGPDEESQKPGLLTEATPAASAPAAKPTEKAKVPEPPPYVKRPGAMQLPNGKVLTFPAPKEGETRKVYAYGHMYECDSEGNFRDITPRKLFHTAFEGNFLALAVEGKTFIPAFLTGLDQEEVKEILKKNYEPIGDETEEEWAQLKAYDDMRCAALQYMEEGGSFDDFVMDFANYEKKSRETNAMCLREVMTLCKEGKIEEAKEMAGAAKKLMEQKGLRPFKLPPHVQAAFDELP